MIIDTETINRFKGESATWGQGSNVAYQDGFAAGKNWAVGAHYVAVFTVERFDPDFWPEDNAWDVLHEAMLPLERMPAEWVELADSLADRPRDRNRLALGLVYGVKAFADALRAEGVPFLG